MGLAGLFLFGVRVGQINFPKDTDFDDRRLRRQVNCSDPSAPCVNFSDQRVPICDFVGNDLKKAEYFYSFECAGCETGWAPALTGSLCVRQSDTYLCNNRPVIVTEVCGGKCVDGRKMVDGKCVLPPHTWKCDGIIQSVSTPCYGLCKNSSEFEMEVPDYVLCGEKCLHRWEAWNCNGKCLHFSEPCNGECLPYDKYPLMFTKMNSECKLAFNPHYDGKRIRGGWKLLNASAFSGISKVRVIPSLRISLSQCPRLYCRSNQKCCLVVEDSHHNIRCPSTC